MNKIPTTPDRQTSLDQWQKWLEYLHPLEMELGLERVRSVAEKAGLLDELPPIVTVAGTNGKGSVVSMLSSVYTEAGYRTATYTSPHLLRFNERICIDQVEAHDQTIVDALVIIEEHRNGVPLTYFEFTTLAAMQIFVASKVDVVVLEVGLGGRLDAVNIWDASCTILTSIAVDHESWLGSSRADIAAEKVAVARSGTPLICAEPDPPRVIETFVRDNDVSNWQVNRDYRYRLVDNQLHVNTSTVSFELPRPGLAGYHQAGNAAAVVVAVNAIKKILPVDSDALGNGLQKASVAGRFEKREFCGVELILDVAHNPAAARALSRSLSDLAPDKVVHAVFAMMGDKDIKGVVEEVGPDVATWHLGNLDLERAMSAELLQEELSGLVPDKEITMYESVTKAFHGAVKLALSGQKQQLVLVFGSFYTVTEVMEILDT